MNKQIKMSYASKDVRLTVDENDKLVKVEVRKVGDPNQFEEVKSSWIGKTPSWNKLDEFLSEAAGVKVQKRRLFDSFEAVKTELMDAPIEVKEAFNSVVWWFDSKPQKPWGKGKYKYVVIGVKKGAARPYLSALYQRFKGDSIEEVMKLAKKKLPNYEKLKAFKIERDDWYSEEATDYANSLK